MTIAVIGIALALPAALYLLVQNLQQLGTSWSGTPTISLFLNQVQDVKAARQLAQRLITWPEITDLDYISPQQALAEFEQQLGLQNLEATLGENPLPGVLVAQIADAASNPKAAHQLITKLQRLPEVDIAQLDLEWLQRLKALTTLAKRGVAILASLLALGVILITSNTIRLAVLNRQEEIRVVKLVGGTDAFVRRPFLYTGAWYGLSGGLLACLILTLTLRLLSDPIDRLAHLYSSHFTLSGLDVGSGLHLCVMAAFLGLSGAYLALAGHLKAIEPT
jgi:cell division transport system permease protein